MVRSVRFLLHNISVIIVCTLYGCCVDCVPSVDRAGVTLVTTPLEEYSEEVELWRLPSRAVCTGASSAFAFVGTGAQGVGAPQIYPYFAL